ncbi:DUF3649 domain-containing protein [Belnapia sp. F-4-1]|uniref:DUF3649 domain-containing protein n=1 Tax=Belnapia sp. F-4-1 TaxID=1545443 RepID=UPI0005B9067A|nr:DUF3649 domain-containing protein [Belnapia sp. F-4-1]
MRLPPWTGILSRSVAAILGGYLLASLVAACCALGLALPRAEAVMTGAMLAFAVQAGAVVYVFAVRSVWRAWAGLALPAALLGGLLWLLQFGGAA